MREVSELRHQLSQLLPPSSKGDEGEGRDDGTGAEGRGVRNAKGEEGERRRGEKEHRSDETGKNEKRRSENGWEGREGEDALARGVICAALYPNLAKAERSPKPGGKGGMYEKLTLGEEQVRPPSKTPHNSDSHPHPHPRPSHTTTPTLPRTFTLNLTFSLIVFLA